MSADRCGGCRFWRETLEHRDPADATWGFGRCRRHAPTIVDTIVKAVMPRPVFNEQVEPEFDDVTMTTASLWPATHSTDWCGEFNRAAEESPS